MSEPAELLTLMEAYRDGGLDELQAQRLVTALSGPERTHILSEFALCGALQVVDSECDLAGLRTRIAARGERSGAVRALRQRLACPSRPSTVRRRLVRGGWALAAGLLLAVGLGLMVPGLRSAPPTPLAVVMVDDIAQPLAAGAIISAAVTQSVLGSDGSSLELDPGTRLRLIAARHWRLEHGRLRCRVAHVAQADFRLDTEHGRIEVLGTVFTVTSDAAHCTVAVDTGQVRVAPATHGDPRLLTAGQHVELTAGSIAPPPAVTWPTGDPLFQNPMDATPPGMVAIFTLDPEHDAVSSAIDTSAAQPHLESAPDFPGRVRNHAWRLGYDKGIRAHVIDIVPEAELMLRGDEIIEIVYAVDAYCHWMGVYLRLDHPEDSNRTFDWHATEPGRWNRAVIPLTRFLRSSPNKGPTFTQGVLRKLRFQGAPLSEIYLARLRILRPAP